MGSRSAPYTSTIQFEELHNMMKRNGSLVLGLFDELSSLYAQLNLFKHNCSDMNIKTVITLNGGSSRTRNYSASISKTAFNICGDSSNQ